MALRHDPPWLRFVRSLQGVEQGIETTFINPADIANLDLSQTRVIFWHPEGVSITVVEELLRIYAPRGKSTVSLREGISHDGYVVRGRKGERTGESGKHAGLPHRYGRCGMACAGHKAVMSVWKIQAGLGRESHNTALPLKASQEARKEVIATRDTSAAGPVVALTSILLNELLAGLGRPS